MQLFYIKATLDNGISKYDHNFKYTLGHIVHPNPDRISKDACGIGIHLAKTMRDAKQYFPNATEYYLAKAGEIIAQDFNKVRCADCYILRKLSIKDINYIDSILLNNYPLLNPLCGIKWLEQHALDYTWEDFNNETIQISHNNQKTTVKAGISKKDIKQVLKAIIK
jgi:hypothetical protein